MYYGAGPQVERGSAVGEGAALYGAGGVVFGEDTANRKAPTGAERGVL